jgi:hypothetical protein
MDLFRTPLRIRYNQGGPYFSFRPQHQPKQYKLLVCDIHTFMSFDYTYHGWQNNHICQGLKTHRQKNTVNQKFTVTVQFQWDLKVQPFTILFLRISTFQLQKLSFCEDLFYSKFCHSI